MKKVILCALIALTLVSCGTTKVTTESPAEVPPREEKIEVVQEVKEEAPQPEAKPEAPQPETKPETPPTVVSAPVPVEEKKNLCTISVTCEKAMDKKEDLPKDGVILNAVTVEFTEGESVFDVLKRCLEGKGINLEYREDATFKSIYIETIGPLSEKDCGAYSGWMYKVNGTPPTCASSDYIIKDGEVIEFYYSC